MKYIAIIESDNELSEDAIKELKETVMAIDTMRKYQKIQEIVKKWELDSWTDNLSYESMIQIREVLEDGEDNN